MTTNIGLDNTKVSMFTDLSQKAMDIVNHEKDNNKNRTEKLVNYFTSEKKRLENELRKLELLSNLRNLKDHIMMKRKEPAPGTTLKEKRAA